jgi:molybdenum cofactor cytidylyltransferase
MAEPDACAAIILAAGASSRLGQPKQLVKIGGETLLRRTTRFAIEAGCSPVIVVLSRDVTMLTSQVDGLAASIVVNGDWQTGMASSLKAGLQAVLLAHPDQAAVMILVCDQPRLNESVLRDLMEVRTVKGSKITASKYHDMLGVPAVFSRVVFSELMELTGEQGARSVMQRNPEQLSWVEFPDGIFDLDTPEDLARLHS